MAAYRPILLLMMCKFRNENIFPMHKAFGSVLLLRQDIEASPGEMVQCYFNVLSLQFFYLYNKHVSKIFVHEIKKNIFNCA